MMFNDSTPIGSSLFTVFSVLYIMSKSENCEITGQITHILVLKTRIAWKEKINRERWPVTGMSEKNKF